MTFAGAGFVPNEVTYPARVLTAYPCVVRRDPTVCGTFPFGEQIGKVSLGGSEKRRGLKSRALLLLFPHRGAHTPRLPVSAHELAMTVGRPAYVPAMSSLFAGPFDGWSRQSMAAAHWYMIRS